MKKVVTHKQIYQNSAFGGISNTTLCGRVNNTDFDKNDGMNVEEEFNCHFCKMTANQAYGQKKIENSLKIEAELKAGKI